MNGLAKRPDAAPLDAVDADDDTSEMECASLDMFDEG